MKTTASRHLQSRVLPLLFGPLLGLHTGLAAPFLYTPGDLVLTLRQSGNSSDLIVNLGPASTFSTAAPDSVIPITRLAAPLFTSTFPSPDGIQWSILGANRPPLVAAFPLQTLWVTSPRTEPDADPVPWLRKGQFVQGNAGSQIDGVGRNAALYSNLTPASPANTAFAVVIPVSNAFAPGPVIGDFSDLVGTFQGRVEGTIPDGFDSDPGNVARADLFELLPGTTASQTLNTPGRHLGYFELTPAGALTFRTGTTPVIRPEILSIVREDNTSTVSFATQTGITYRIRATEGSGLLDPIPNWTAGNSLVGDGSVRTLQDSSSSDLRFYVIEILP
jgi:hypothetical protein